MLAARILMKESTISFVLKPPSLLFKRTNKIIKLFIPDMDVANAKPPVCMGNINMKFKIIFIIKAIPATFVGVIVSLRAKKQD
jgi:hypothetical protein